MNTVDTSTIANVLAIARPIRIPVRSMIVSVARRSGRFISRSRSVADAITARHPVPPHQQGGPPGSTTMWAIEPLLPWAPCKRRPATMHADSTVVSTISVREAVDLPGCAEPALALREGGTLPMPSTTGRPVRSSRWPRSGNAVHAANQVRRHRPGGLIERRGGAHPDGDRSGDVVGRGGEHTTDQLLEDPPHLASRGADAVSHEHVTARIDDAGGEPHGVDDHRQDGGTRRTHGREGTGDPERAPSRTTLRP